MEVLELWFASRYQAIWHLGCMSWPSCYIMSVQHFLGKYSVNTLYLFHPMSAKHHTFWHWGEFSQCSLYGRFLDGGVGQRLFGLSTTAPPEKIQMRNSYRDSGSVQQPHPENKVTGIAKSENISSGAQCKVKLIPQQFVYWRTSGFLTSDFPLSKWKTTSFGNNEFLPGTQHASIQIYTDIFTWVNLPFLYIKRTTSVGRNTTCVWHFHSTWLKMKQPFYFYYTQTTTSVVWNNFPGISTGCNKNKWRDL